MALPAVLYPLPEPGMDRPAPSPQALAVATARRPSSPLAPACDGGSTAAYDHPHASIEGSAAAPLCMRVAAHISQTTLHPPPPRKV